MEIATVSKRISQTPVQNLFPRTGFGEQRTEEAGNRKIHSSLLVVKENKMDVLGLFSVCQFIKADLIY